jgi:S-adenosylmethionine:tRNA ribosyltransferase-isomerase
LLVFNDTRVLPARLHAHKASGGRVEILLERVVGPNSAWVQIRANHAPRSGGEIHLPAGVRARVVARRGPLYELEFDREVAPYFEAHGEVPLPPYIVRAPEPADKERYQTVFARDPGAVAAPTAGLHFDAPLLDRLAAGRVERACLTLHVGLGTFAPMHCDRVEDHALHRERISVPSSLCQQVERARARGGRIVAVGTTVVRALESAVGPAGLAPYEGETALFIYPGHEFRVVDAMITNFHLPESSLLALVAAFAGLDRTLAAYRHAVAAGYRFFSYGDAMFVTARAAAGTARAL